MGSERVDRTPSTAQGSPARVQGPSAFKRFATSLAPRASRTYSRKLRLTRATSLGLGTRMNLRPWSSVVLIRGKPNDGVLGGMTAVDPHPASPRITSRARTFGK